MTKEEVYRVWRPDNSPWSRWVKPVLFSYLRDTDLAYTEQSVRRWDIPRTKATAILVNLPGAEGVTMGLTLCLDGRFRPVPVYNACPFAPADATNPTLSLLESRPASVASVVDLTPTLTALCGTTCALAAIRLTPDAPPAFLIDANRGGNMRQSETPGWFDNRSFITAADFPSAELLKQHDISRIVLIQTKERLQPDLLRVLWAWQERGLMIFEQAPWAPWDPQVRKVKPLALWQLAWHRLQTTFGYEKDLQGSFGRVIPISSQG